MQYPEQLAEKVFCKKCPEAFELGLLVNEHEGILYKKNGVIFHSTNKRSHWIKDNISNPNLNNSTSLKNSNLNNSILLKSVSYCYFYC